MTGPRTFIVRLVGFFSGHRRESELNDEIQTHLDLLNDEHMRAGLSLYDARAAARREFGGVEQIKEAYRDERALPFVDTTVQDLRYALRTFRRSPGFVVAVVLSLSLGIGVNTAIFTVLNALMLQSLPVRNPQELFIAWPQDPAGLPAGPARSPLQFSYPVFEQLQRSAAGAGTLAAMSRIARMYRVVDGERETQTTAVQLVSGEFFPMLGVSPVRGRVLTPEDNRQIGGHPVAVISHGFWLRAFGGAADILGRGLTLNATHFTVVGVSAQGFSGVWLESPVDMWIPLMMQNDVHYEQNASFNDADKSKPWITQEGIRWLDVVGRGSNGALPATLSTAYQRTVAQQAESISEPDRREELRLQENRISLNYFATTGMRLLEGRAFDDRDKENTPKVAIVNRAMVQRFFHGQSAVGRRIGYGTPDTEIVGVVEDARVNRIQDSPRPMAFYPLAQQSVDAAALDVRAIGDPRSIVTEVRRAVTELDASLPIDRVTILSDQVVSGLRQERLIAGVTSIFGILALGLACVGLFGVMSYALSRRTTEFGIRLALGAERSQVLASVFRESLAIVTYGLAAGIPAALTASLLLSDLVFGVSLTDPTTVSCAVLLLAAVAAVASLLPAWRASRVDPMVALRCE